MVPTRQTSSTTSAMGTRWTPTAIGSVPLRRTRPSLTSRRWNSQSPRGSGQAACPMFSSSSVRSECSVFILCSWRVTATVKLMPDHWKLSREEIETVEHHAGGFFSARARTLTPRPSQFEKSCRTPTPTLDPNGPHPGAAPMSRRRSAAAS